MKKKERKELGENLLSAIKKVLKSNKTDLTNKFEKIIKRSIKQIVKKSRNKRKVIIKKNNAVAQKNGVPQKQE